MQRLTFLEQETIVNWNNSEKLASVYICDPSMIRKMDALVKKDKRVTVESEDKYSKTYIVPKGWVKIILPRKLSKKRIEQLKVQAKTLLGRKKSS